MQTNLWRAPRLMGNLLGAPRPLVAMHLKLVELVACLWRVVALVAYLRRLMWLEACLWEVARIFS